LLGKPLDISLGVSMMWIGCFIGKAYDNLGVGRIGGEKEGLEGVALGEFL